MAITFPTTLDTLTNSTSTQVLAVAGGVGVSDMLNNLNDAVEALEAKVGIDSSAVSTTLDYLVKNTNASNVIFSGTPVFSGAAGVTTNTITERTAASGVTIDGLLIKDSKLATNDSVVTANVTDAAITSRKAALTCNVNATVGSLTGHTSSTFTDVTNASVSITTDVTSHVHLTASGRYYLNAAIGAENLQTRIVRDSTALGSTQTYDALGVNVAIPFAYSFVDRSVAAGTYAYKVQLSSTDNTTTVNMDTVRITAFVVAA